MTKFNLFCILLLVVQSASAQSTSWIKTGGSIQNDEVHAISTQPSGSSFVGGNFYSPCTFDTFQLTSTDSANVFVTKITNTGSTMWLKYFPTPGNSTGTVYGVAAAWDGGCYLTGIWSDSIWIDTTLFVSNGTADPFFSRLDINGSVIWAKRGAGATWNDAGTSVVTNQQGEVYFAGNYSDTLMIDTSTIINSYGGYGSFIAKFDSTGMLLWMKNFQGNSNLINEIAIDQNSDVIVTGNFNSLAVFDTIQLTSQGSSSMFIAKYESTGQFLWVKQDGGLSEVKGEGIAICPNNDILITGSYTFPSATFDTISIPYLSGDDFSSFVARYDQNGNVKWVNYQSSIHGDVWNSEISTITGNTIYFSGFYYDTLFFSNGSFMESGPSSYIAACDIDGNMLWVKKIAGATSIDFSVDAVENLYMIGNYQDSLHLPPYQFASHGGTDFFYAQLGASTVGIQQSLGSRELLVSPNPSNGNLTLTLGENLFSNPVLQIYNELGVLITQQTYYQSEQTQKIELNLGYGVKSGLYMLVLMNKDKRYTKKIILER